MLAEGSTTVSISSRNGRCGGCAMVSRSGVATNCSGGSAAPSSFSARSVERRRRRARAGAGAAPFGLGFSVSVARTRVAVGSSEHVEIDGLDQPVGRAVVLKADGAGLFGAHIHSTFREPSTNLAVATAISLRGRRLDGDVFTHIPAIGFLL